MYHIKILKTLLEFRLKLVLETGVKSIIEIIAKKKSQIFILINCKMKNPFLNIQDYVPR